MKSFVWFINIIAIYLLSMNHTNHCLWQYPNHYIS